MVFASAVLFLCPHINSVNRGIPVLQDYVLEILSHYLSGLKWVDRLDNSFYNCLLVPFDDIVKPSLAEKSTT